MFLFKNSKNKIILCEKVFLFCEFCKTWNSSVYLVEQYKNKKCF